MKLPRTVFPALMPQEGRTEKKGEGGGRERCLKEKKEWEEISKEGEGKDTKRKG